MKMVHGKELRELVQKCGGVFTSDSDDFGFYQAHFGPLCILFDTGKIDSDGKFLMLKYGDSQSGTLTIPQ